MIKRSGYKLRWARICPPRSPCRRRWNTPKAAGQTTERAFELVVHNFDAQIEVGNRRPNRPGTDLPVRPIGVGSRRRAGRNTRSKREEGAGVLAVVQLAVRAVERGLPVRHPPVLEASGDAPTSGQVVACAARIGDAVKDRPDCRVGDHREAALQQIAPLPPAPKFEPM